MFTTVPPDPSYGARPAEQVAWPAAAETNSKIQFNVTLEQDGATVRLVRSLLCDGSVVARVVAWSATYRGTAEAKDAYEALSRSADLFDYWSVGATALGPDWLTPTTSMVIEDYLNQRAEDLAMADREADEARRLADEDLAASTKITLYYVVRKKMFCLTLERGDDEFWSIRFDEKWERERFGDWMQWQRHRFGDFAEYMKEGDRFELERQLLREMLVTEQAVKKQGLGAGGRRPLRFWRGEA